MNIDRPERGREYLTYESREEFSGWDVLGVERYKPGVCRVHLASPSHFRSREFRIVYAKDEHLPEHWIRPPEKDADDPLQSEFVKHVRRYRPNGVTARLAVEVERLRAEQEGKKV